MNNPQSIPLDARPEWTYGPIFQRLIHNLIGCLPRSLVLAPVIAGLVLALGLGAYVRSESQVVDATTGLAVAEKQFQSERASIASIQSELDAYIRRNNALLAEIESFSAQKQAAEQEMQKLASEQTGNGQ